RKSKDNPYGLIPGETPYPDWEGPSAEQCEQVYRVLADIHADVPSLPPETIPAPSLEVAGCGEVPSVLDGLIRTVLSGSVTFEAADKMLQALVKKFGILEEGVGKGSVNWNKVRTASYGELFEQLKDGGLGRIKSKHIQAILNMVYEENMERRAAFLEEKKTGVETDIAGASDKTEGQKNLEILKTDQEILSLDHMHGMTKDEAMRHLVRYPGVGVKTAACVTLFSLQKPCFAVDTHVYRMSKWLRWVPEKTNEDNTFHHLEVRCPDHLKYGLHQLFIRHGKTCHRCNDKSFTGTKAWNKTICPLEDLLDRYTKKE
ncbi:DNA glycosylase, partial [Pseudomassariella vexata]